jgi:hypothetical protein
MLEKDLQIMNLFLKMSFSKADYARFENAVKQVMTDIDYLIDKKVLVEANYLQSDDDSSIPLEMAWPHIQKAEHFCKVYLNTSLEECGYPPPIGEIKIPQKDNYEPVEIQAMEDYYLMVLETNRLLTRVFSINPRVQAQGVDRVPILDDFTYSPEEEDLSRREMVISLTLEKVPVPSGNVSLDDILDFKSTAGAKNELIRFRKWATDVVRGDLQKTEIEQEIEYLLSEYENEMNLNKLKYKHSAVEVLVVTSAEILENLLKLKWSEAAKSLFSIKRRNVNLLTAEATACGREMAYLSRVGETFAHQERNNRL